MRPAFATLGAMPADIAGDLAATRRKPEEADALEVKGLNQFCEIVGIIIHVIALPGLAGPTVAAPVMGDDAVTVVGKEEGL